MVTLTIRAYNADGYHLDILVQDEQQVRMNDTRVKQGIRGCIIDPKEFPEMAKFEVILEDRGRR